MIKIQQDSTDDILEFYRSIKDQFPTLSYEHVEKICLSPFVVLKRVFDEGTLQNIKIKHIGKFKINPSRLKKIRNNIDNTNYGLVMSQERKQYMLDKIDEYFSNNVNNDSTEEE